MPKNFKCKTSLSPVCTVCLLTLLCNVLTDRQNSTSTAFSRKCKQKFKLRSTMPRKTRISEKLLLFPDLLLAILSLELSAEIYEQRLILNLQENDS